MTEENLAEEIESIEQDFNDANQSDAVSEGTPSGGTSKTETVKGALMSTKPHQDIKTVERPMSLEDWDKHAFRAVQKMTNSDGVPAFADLFLALLGLYMKQKGYGGTSSEGIEDGEEEASKTEVVEYKDFEEA